MVTVTENAASALRDMLEAKNASPDKMGLRLLVEKGGCAGMSYAMKIDAPSVTDQVVERDGVSFFVDPESLEYLDDSEVDYVDALNDSGFKINNPNAARSCGCGTSFEPASAEKAPEYDPSMDSEVCGGEGADLERDA
ncbi:iron-sulfur cluster assembly accessory protein [bacterium]|nr:iron-sulfur cluster assembly accessory protein [bacterium]MDA7673099.1 iron-sulfur cluster assembly accessory protein [Verrucomicrobiales bacterium]MDC0311967.1 iron-sulfur cluster assembly accessory protein [bacterium]